MNLQNQQLISQLKSLADPVRLRLVMLCTRGECTVSELTGITGLSQPRVSQHLKNLCDSGLLARFRDGHFVYYRAPNRGNDARVLRRLLSLAAGDEIFDADLDALTALRAGEPVDEVNADDRDLYRRLVELTVSAPLGDLLDVGSGRGDLLKLFASRAQRVVGVDIDPDARRRARAKLMTAGIPNCSLRQGDMYRLPWDGAEFDTVILDDVLLDAERPVAVLLEARRILKPGGRLIVVARVDTEARKARSAKLPGWSADAGLRLAAPKLIPENQPRWMLATATQAEPSSAAA